MSWSVGGRAPPPGVVSTAGGNILLTYIPEGFRAERGSAAALDALGYIGTFQGRIAQQIAMHGPVKIFVQCIFRFQKSLIQRGQRQVDDSILLNIASHAHLVDLSSVRRGLQEISQEFRDRLHTMQFKSGMVLAGISAMRLIVSRYSPARGGTFIETPDEIRAKKAIINIQNEDSFCLLYCLLYHKHKSELQHNPHRVTKYRQFKDEMEALGADISFPVNPDSPDIYRLETRLNTAINIYVLEDGYLAPRRVSRLESMRTYEGQQLACNLLLLSDGEKYHFTYITRINVLCASKNVKIGKRTAAVLEDKGQSLDEIVLPVHKRAKRATVKGQKDIDKSEDSGSDDSIEVDERPSRRTYPCLFCMNFFSSTDRLRTHVDGGCGQSVYGGPVREIYPQAKDGVTPVIEWDEGKPQASIGPVRVYADFESIMVPCADQADLDDYGYDDEECTKKISTHKICSASFVVVAPGHELDGTFELIRAANDEQCGEFIVRHFIYALNDLGKKMKASFQSLKFLPIFFHNLAGYDGHFITLAIGRMENARKWRKEVVAKNTETFACMTYGFLRFLDSYALLGPGMSLDTAVKNLSNKGTDFSKFNYTKSGFRHVEDQSILFQKGSYPYDYMTTTARFSETTIPSFEAFESKLDCNVKQEVLVERQQRALTAWNKFGCHSLGDYHDEYLKLDVYLLADVFEEHRRLCIEDYGLDIGNGIFLSLPNFSWFAMLKKTQVKLEQITDPDMYQMIEKGKRGGQAIITHRYAKANNRYIGFDERQPESYIMYWDANNLYGLAMSMKLPIRNFRWGTVNDLTDIDGNTGYFAEVDLDYPEDLHDEHSDYPLAPEQFAVHDTELSPLQYMWYCELDKCVPKSEKLCGTLQHKRKYVVHSQLLRYYLSKGMKLRYVHRVLLFDQEAWLEPYIRYNTERRAVATTESGKAYYKLLNNAVFGKTMENVRNRSNLKLVSERKELLKLVSKPHYKRSYIFQPDDVEGNFLVGVEMQQLEVKLDKPVYAGISILDLSKLHMYKFHYDTIKPKYGNRAKLLFTDTDSLCYHIHTEDVYRDVIQDELLREQMDLSETNLDDDTSFVKTFNPEQLEVYKGYMKHNKKVLGKFKDEAGGIPIKEFVGLRAKCYSFITAAEEETLKAKGVKTAAVDAYIRHEDYKRILEADVTGGLSTQFHCFRSFNHRVTTVQIKKSALTRYDDKRYILGDGITSRPFGHFRNQVDKSADIAETLLQQYQL